MIYVTVNVTLFRLALVRYVDLFGCVDLLLPVYVYVTFEKAVTYGWITVIRLIPHHAVQRTLLLVFEG